MQTTKVGLVMNVLSQLTLTRNKADFITGLVRGFGSNFLSTIRAELSNRIFSGANERAPVDTQKNPMDFTVADGAFKALLASPPEFSAADFTDDEEPPALRTVGLQRDLEVLNPWIVNCEPFIVVGPEGCGKSLLIRTAFDELRKHQKIQVATIHCNAQTSAQQIIQKLNQICLKGTSAQGRIFKPKECSRLVI